MNDQAIGPQRAVLPTERKLYYGGAWHSALSGRTIAVSSPATGAVLCEIADAGVEDAHAAIAAAQQGYQEWRRVPPMERARILREIAATLRRHGRELALLDAEDGGNPVTEMMGDVNIAAGQMEFFAGLVTEMKGNSIPMGPHAVNFSVREPRGVVARIIPFNHPFMFCAGKSAAPLAAGNAVIVKPPEQAPLSAMRLAELIGGLLPPGVFNVLPGRPGRGRRAQQPSGHRHGRADRQRADRAGGDEGRGGDHQAGAAGTGRQERADRLPGLRSGRRGRRRRVRHELHLVRPILRLHQPGLPARGHP